MSDGVKSDQTGVQVARPERSVRQGGRTDHLTGSHCRPLEHKLLGEGRIHCAIDRKRDASQCPLVRDYGRPAVSEALPRTVDGARSGRQHATEVVDVAHSHGALDVMDTDACRIGRRGVDNQVALERLNSTRSQAGRIGGGHPCDVHLTISQRQIAEHSLIACAIARHRVRRDMRTSTRASGGGHRKALMDGDGARDDGTARVDVRARPAHSQSARRGLVDGPRCTDCNKGGVTAQVVAQLGLHRRCVGCRCVDGDDRSARASRCEARAILRHERELIATVRLPAFRHAER
eukprot:6868949-Prymnesium_polylepis.4